LKTGEDDWKSIVLSFIDHHENGFMDHLEIHLLILEAISLSESNTEFERSLVSNYRQEHILINEKRRKMVCGDFCKKSSPKNQKISSRDNRVNLAEKSIIEGTGPELI
jgi:hypothetical protein